MSSYLRALSFLTIIPLPFVQFDPEGQQLSRAAACFPLAGATIGLIVAGLTWLNLIIFPPAVAVVFVFIFSFFLTRGLHFDGLADTADGLIGTTSREKAFKAMDDSAIGVMGAAVLFFTYLLKFMLLIEVNRSLVLIAILIMPLIGRWAIVVVGAWFPPARNRGLGDLFLRGLNGLILLKASLGATLILTIVALFDPQLILPLICGSVIALGSALLLAGYAARRLGGISGDLLGAASEVGELFFLLGFVSVL